MVRTTKQSEKTSVSAAAAAVPSSSTPPPLVEESAAPIAVEKIEKISKKSSSKKQKDENGGAAASLPLSTKKEKVVAVDLPKEEVVVAVPPLVVEVPSESVLPEVVAVELSELASFHTNTIEKLEEFGAKLQVVINTLSALKVEYKTLLKVTVKELKIAHKSSSRKKRTGNRQPSGFTKPCKISSALAVFLNVPEETELARTAVSKEINQYIRTHELQDKTNGRQINPDAKLKKLLNLDEKDVLTYFNLQKYMKHHFLKTDVSSSSDSDVTV